jgi:hypothetical protein
LALSSELPCFLFYLCYPCLTFILFVYPLLSSSSAPFFELCAIPLSYCDNGGSDQ